MRIQIKFQLFFTVFMLVIIFIMAGISLYYIRETYMLIEQAPSKDLLIVMAERLFTKNTISLISSVVLVTAISIPVGIYLFHLISGKYLAVFTEVKRIAENRLRLKTPDKIKTDDREILIRYIHLMLEDQEKLRDYEKVKSWKDGARMLMHELKNPLTPLKLSLENISYHKHEGVVNEKDIQNALYAIKDIENILSNFKDLVNIEFGKKEKIEIKGLMAEIFQQAYAANKKFPVENSSVSKTLELISEKNLIKMLFINLINNGIEENPTGFFIRIQETDAWLEVSFITKDSKIEHAAKVFRPGYSGKGKERGFGLFLSKLISDYLDLNLTFENTALDVIFSVKFTKTS
jgi:two-component system nitrogen regulation sensor histidine kinase NtrY